MKDKSLSAADRHIGVYIDHHVNIACVKFKQELTAGSVTDQILPSGGKCLSEIPYSAFFFFFFFG